MTVNHPITVDLVQPGLTPRLYAMQHDANSRVIVFTLTQAGTPWEAPEGAIFGLSYRKTDGTRGYYTEHIVRSDATVSVTVAPQVLTCPGTVDAALVCNAADGSRIAAFPLQIQVRPDPAAGKTDSDDYFNPSDALRYTPQQLTEAQKQQARANLGLTEPAAETWLYNGVELPPLPQWDKEEFPYAFISENIPYGQYDGYAYRLHLYAAPCYVAYDENGKVNRVFTEKNSPYQLWGGNTGAVAWDFSGDGNNLTGSATNNLPLWVNADMYYNGNDPTNSLYMSQSNPVPVYPESGGSAADAVLFTPQTLTEEQKAQARENIGIVGTGVCLPAVELETDFAEDTALSAEDSAKMDSVALMGMPVVVRFSVVEEMGCAVFSSMGNGAAFCASLNGAQILIAKSDSGWAVEIRIGL